MVSERDMGGNCMTPNIKELCERLRRSAKDTTAFCPELVYRNPDGPEAAETIAALVEERDRLREALGKIETFRGVGVWPAHKMVEIASQALGGEVCEKRLDNE